MASAADAAAGEFAGDAAGHGDDGLRQRDVDVSDSAAELCVLLRKRRVLGIDCGNNFTDAEIREAESASQSTEAVCESAECC